MRTLSRKLLLLILPLSLAPLVGISIYAYYQAKERITEDRIVLYLEQLAIEIADNLQLIILEKKEETVSMSLYSEFRHFVTGRSSEPPQLLLDQLAIVHEVYDLLALFDVDGTLLLTSSINRSRLDEPLDAGELAELAGTRATDYTPGGQWLQQVRSGYFGYLPWHRSELIERLYDYEQDDVARQYSIGFAAPILDERGVVVGGILALMNWQYIQEVLDKVEEDLAQRSLSTGYAFLFDSDDNTVIGHKYRRNRDLVALDESDVSVARDNYGLRLLEDFNLPTLRRAVINGDAHLGYEYPQGIEKISGLARIPHEFFRWTCGVGINNADIFAPVQELLDDLIWVTTLSAVAVIVLVFSVARQISTPLKKLTAGAGVIAGGDLSQRVEVTGRDEIGHLAETFNEMASSLEERSRALLDLNRSLEEKVLERTRELEEKNRQVEEAYQELKQTQVQLVQSEKMASLGQLVAGIAHEIKNPLNFIYGNTDFLKKYVANLRRLIELYEQEARLEPAAAARLADFKRGVNFSFMLEDLDTLIRNLEEGSERIHSIIGDLKTFSRLDTDEFQRVDIHEPIDLALNLLQNEYRDRINIHRDYGTPPPVECHPGRISQVFMNLLANACQAIEGRGEVWIRTSADNGQAVVEIEDTGQGIEAAHLEKVFEPFFTTKPVGEGTGLGLSISYGIIQQHQGTIEVESEPGRGTRFRVRLPARSPVRAQA